MSCSIVLYNKYILLLFSIINIQFGMIIYLWCSLTPIMIYQLLLKKIKKYYFFNVTNPSYNTTIKQLYIYINKIICMYIYDWYQINSKLIVNLQLISNININRNSNSKYFSNDKLLLLLSILRPNINIKKY
jgi:hypothetical protein